MLRFDCAPAEVVSESAYRRLLAEIDARAAAGRGLPWPRDAQIDAIAKSGLFDPDFYCETYKDVVATGADPLRHYIRYGDAEGRWPNPFFDPLFYRSQFDVAGPWPVSALHHYVTFGEAAGLKPSTAFDQRRYRASNPDLGPWLDRPLVHFLWIGRHHGLSANRRSRLAAGRQIHCMRLEAPPLAASGLVRAVNVIGPLDRLAGLGVSARGYLQGATLSGVGPVGTQTAHMGYGLQSKIQSPTDFTGRVENAAINLVHIGGDVLPSWLETAEAAVMAGRYNIAIWYWELPTLRPEWVTLMNRFHAFWAPTPFIAEALKQLTDKPIALVPPYLPWMTKRADSARRTAETFPHFLYCFDANSIVERKNPGLLLDAFLAAFPQGSGARLTFKVTYPNRSLAEIERLYAAAAQYEGIEVVDDLLSDDDILKLIASATAYVSPHRSEGLGLTIVEAMALGTPVIATPFSGVAQFVTPRTAWPIDYRLVELDDNFGPYPKGFVWADPRLDSLVSALRSVIAKPEQAAKRASAAKSCVLDHFASPAVLQTYRKALDQTARTIGV